MYIYAENIGQQKRRITPLNDLDLSTRYQLNENLRTLRAFRRGILYIAFFNLVSTLCCTVRTVTASPLLYDVFSEAFNLSFAV